MEEKKVINNIYEINSILTKFQNDKKKYFYFLERMDEKEFFSLLRRDDGRAPPARDDRPLPPVARVGWKRRSTGRRPNRREGAARAPRRRGRTPGFC